MPTPHATLSDPAPTSRTGVSLPADPFTAMQYHFGMLLGVEELETAQGYPLGKIRLHNAWLHREGVVWGLDVTYDAGHREIRVSPGLALDAAGHELHLDLAMCVDLAKWLEAHRDELPLDTFDDVPGQPEGTKAFAAHVVASFKACLARQVPSISVPCGDADAVTSYSRVIETIDLRLRPGPAPQQEAPYPRLRVLMRVAPSAWELRPEMADVVAKRDEIEALPAVERPREYLEAFRRFAAQDQVELAPASTDRGTTPFPEDPTAIVLANVADLWARKGTGGAWTWVEDHAPRVDIGVRPAHIATSTIQELLCGPAAQDAAAGPSPHRRAAAAAARGPQVQDVTRQPQSIEVVTDAPIAVPTLGRESVFVSSYSDAAGWTPIVIGAVTMQRGGGGRRYRVQLGAKIEGPLRVVVRGTGPTPVMSQDGAHPLGAPGPGGPHDGIDYVKML